MEDIKIHSKMKGNIGEAAIAKNLALNGFCVFKELGDLSKIDLIAEKNQKLLRVQVKAITSANREYVTFDSRKSGPNYSFAYTDNMVDLFAIYVLDMDKIAYLPAKLACSQSITSLRVIPTKNKQHRLIHWFDDYAGLERVLRDYKLDTCNGEDIVHVSTQEIVAQETV